MASNSRGSAEMCGKQKRRPNAWVSFGLLQPSSDNTVVTESSLTIHDAKQHRGVTTRNIGLMHIRALPRHGANVMISLASAAFQTRTDPSSPPETTTVPSGVVAAR